jgi:NTE family protein
MRVGLWVLVATVLLGGCATARRFDPDRRPTVVALSAGGPDGVVHLGALRAVRARGLRVGAVVGTSMGALVGALYATAPQADTTERFVALARRYEATTRAEARDNGLGLGLLLGAAATIVSSGAALPALAAGAGYLLGAGRTPTLDRRRLVRVMDDHFGGAPIEALPVGFAALYFVPRGGGVALIAARSGSLAEAVGGSVANPLLFPDVDVARAERLDPGADRVAAVPVEDACRLFPGHDVLAINVTPHPAFVSEGLPCARLEVRLPAPGLSPEEVFAFGPAFERAVAEGERATEAALRAHLGR